MDKTMGVHCIGTANLVNWPFQPNWWNDRDKEVNGNLRDRPDRGHFPAAKDNTAASMDLDFQRRYAIPKAQGFTLVYLDGLNSVDHITKATSAFRGAAAAGIKITYQVDTNHFQATIKGTAYPSDAAINAAAASKIVAFANYPATFWTSDGALFLSPYNANLAANAGKPAWDGNRWKDIVARVEVLLGKPVAFYPNFSDTGPVAAFQTALGAKMRGFGIWGGANPSAIAAHAGHAKLAHDRGLEYIQYTRHMDIRPRENKFDENVATKTLRDSWDLAMLADHTMHPTITDYFEGAHLEPSEQRGSAWMTLSGYFLRRFVLGRYPTVTQDAVFLCHRQTTWQAKPTLQTDPLMQPRIAGSAVDIIEVVAFLTGPGEVFLDGTSLGIWTPGSPPYVVFTQPLTLGGHTAAIVRNGTVAASIGSLLPVVESLPRQTLDYTLATNISEGQAWFTDAAPTVPAVPTAVPWAVPIVPDPTDRIKAAQTQAGIASDGLFGNDSLTAWEDAETEKAALQAANTQLAATNAELQSSALDAMGYLDQAHQALGG